MEIVEIGVDIHPSHTTWRCVRVEVRLGWVDDGDRDGSRQLHTKNERGKSSAVGVKMTQLFLDSMQG